MTNILDDLQNEISNRLNIEKSSLNSKNYLTFKILKSKCIKQITDEKLIIPSLLLFDLKNIVENEFKNLTISQKITKLNQILFIPLILYNNIYRRIDDDPEKLLYKDGYQLSKELLTSVMSPYDLYKARNILLEKEIIKNIQWNDGYYFSIKNKKAIKYILNSKYKNLETEEIQNNYVSKFSLLLKNGLAMRK